MNRARIAIVVACLALLPVVPAWAQEGLVLSGGGGRGLAHAGVLIALEERGHDPGIVVGASMGAIIGALYAAGYSPREVERIVLGQDWSATFALMPLLFGPERRVFQPVLELDPTLRGFGQGFVADWRINRTLVHLLFDAQARSGGDFDRLARRFRAVTADLATGEEFVPAGGDLARVVRASMAVPGVFSPVPWGDRFLIDGGVANNLPVTVARELDARRVIASDVLWPPEEIEGLDPFRVAIRGLRLLIRNAIPPGTDPDVLILPHIAQEFTEASFPRDATPLVRAGYRAALAELGRASDDWPAPRALPPPPDSLHALDIVSAYGGGDLVRAAFRGVVPGRYDPGRVLAAVDRLYATGHFEAIWPWVEVEDGRRVLRVLAQPIEPTLLTGAAGYDTDRGFRGWASFRGRLGRSTPAEAALAVMGSELERGASLELRGVPPRLTPLAWSVGAHARERDVRRFDDREIVGETRVRRAGGWLGLERRRLAPDLVASVSLIGEDVEVEDGARGLAAGPFVRLGALEPPSRVVGVAPVAEAEWRVGDVEYRRGRAAGSVDLWAGRWRLAVVGDAAVVGGAAPLDVWPALGDERMIPGLRWGELRGRDRLVAGADVAYPLPLEAMLRLRARAGRVGDPIDHDGAAWRVGADLGLLWTSPFGALQLSVGSTTRGEWRLDLGIGPEF